jgi:protein-L-isoaspartate(D-aspartate) O-methyltransferase
MGTGERGAGELHRALVDMLVNRGLIQSPSVEAAFRAVSRHLFLPNEPIERAYADDAIPTKVSGGAAISSASQPAIVAIMLEQLELRPGHRVLEIGAGTGYNAALMAHIVGESGQVVTVDIDDDLVAGAREHLSAAGYPQVEVVHGDGAYGYPDAAPYDRIVLTVAASDLAPAWSEQLAADGRLLLPLRVKGDIQKVVAFEPRDGYMESISAQDGGFMPLRGSAAWTPHQWRAPRPDLGLSLSVDDAADVNTESVLRLLEAGPSQETPTGVRLTVREVLGGLDLWLVLHDVRACMLQARDSTALREDVPWLVGEPGKWSVALGLVDPAGLALLTQPPAQAGASRPDFELLVRGYGEAESLVQRCIELVRTWEAAGRPSSRTLRIRAYPRASDYEPSPGELTVDKPLTRLVLDWTHSGGHAG